jgi:uncharacterized Zn-binding protein involved in type VI secretion
MGQPAARLTDMHVCPMVTGIVPHVGGPILPACAPTVLTGKLPQARVTDLLTCVGPPDVIVKGSATVFVSGLPAARMLDTTAHGGVSMLGCFTVLIGDSASSGGGSGAGPMGMGKGGAGGGSPGAGMVAGFSPPPPAMPNASGALASVASFANPAAQAKTLKAAAKSGAPFCERCQRG